MSDLDMNEPAGLTPFEFALAGVTPAEGARSVSVRVIDDMRALLDEMVDAPIVLAGLNEFVDDGGSMGNHADHRSAVLARPFRNATAAGNFIDITPAELNGGRPVRQRAATPDEPAASETPSVSAKVADLEEPAVPEEPAASVVAAAVPPAIEPSASEAPSTDTAETPAGEASTDTDVPSPETGADDVEPDQVLGKVDTGQIRTPTGRFSATPAGEVEPGVSTDELVATGPIAGAEALGLLAPVIAGAEMPTQELSFEDADPRGGAILEPTTVGVATGGPPLVSPDRIVDLGGPTTAGKLTSVLAVIGTAAAAALVAGGIWWATTNDRPAAEETAGDQIGTLIEDSAETTTVSTSEPEADETLGSAGADAGEDTGRSDFGSSSSSATNTTIEVQLGVDRGTIPRPSVATTTRRPATTEASTSSTEAVSTTATTEPTTVTTEPAVATTVPAPPTTVTAPPLVYIGDRVTVDSYDGPGLAGVSVELWLDNNADGRADTFLSRTSTDANGNYHFDVAAGCYEVRFAAASGYQIRSDLAAQGRCLEPGQSAPRLDAIAIAPVLAPSACAVDPASFSFFLGVHVYENNRAWADSYVFYDNSGRTVITVGAGSRDRAPSNVERLWYGSTNGFDHRSVRSVAAVRDGRTSSAVSCSR